MGEIVVLGLDPDTFRIGWFMASADRKHFCGAGTFELEGKDFDERFQDLVRSFNPFRLCEGAPDIVGIETPWVGKNAQTALKLGHVFGWIKGLCLKPGMKVYSVSPAEGKRALSGDPQANEQTMVTSADWFAKAQLIANASELTGWDVHAAHALGCYEHVVGLLKEDEWRGL